ncbi:methyltransferase domain-containing protein [Deinococcus radiomollis]|uniref:class I SAM-dependent methyltransferase n=1 Tax=Deinococcus radiomollis TaxID=468916 RepID=UPI0038916B9D
MTEQSQQSNATSSREQFGAHAEKYAASTVHRFGPSLPMLLRLADPQPHERALDVATGTGNTAFAVAGFAQHVTGLDVSPGMLAQARARAEREGVDNVSFQDGSAEHLPFPGAGFDLVTSRHAPHHFRDLGAFLREARRVLKPGGRLVVADQITPEGKQQAEMQTWVEVWQQTRDPSHFRQRTGAEWRSLAAEAGFTWAAEQTVPYRLDFDWWTKQSGCSPETAQRLRQHARQASPEVRRALGLEFASDGQVAAHHEPMLVVRLER